MYISEKTNVRQKEDTPARMASVRTKAIRKTTKMPEFYIYPKFLFRLDITDSARCAYILMLSRTRLSIANNWIDERGFAYIRYAQAELAKDMNCGMTKARSVMHELESCGLIVSVQKQPYRPAVIYVKLPVEGIESPDEIISGRSQESEPVKPVENRVENVDNPVESAPTADAADEGGIIADNTTQTDVSVEKCVENVENPVDCVPPYVENSVDIVDNPAVSPHINSSYPQDSVEKDFSTASEDKNNTVPQTRYRRCVCSDTVGTASDTANNSNYNYNKYNNNNLSDLSHAARSASHEETSSESRGKEGPASYPDDFEEGRKQQAWDFISGSGYRGI